MYSMNAIGKFISNFRDFYNEINAATLTGAIDVIVVEQPDGSYTCSPFHVRFGKLGVLRSREKVVDIEVNGEQLDIHMKLGDSGEAFFVEEVAPEELGEIGYIPPHLACSPIPQDDGPFSMECVKIEDGSTSEKIGSEAPNQDSGALTEVIVSSQEKINNGEQVVPNKDLLQGTSESPQQSVPKMFCAETVDDVESNGKIQKISVANGEFRPILLEKDDNLSNVEDSQIGDDAGAIEGNYEEVDGNSLSRKNSFKDTGSLEEPLKRTASSAKRKKRRKSLMKRKASQKKGNNNTNSQSELSEGNREVNKEVNSSENAEESDAVMQLNDDERKLPEDIQISSVSSATTVSTSTTTGGCTPDLLRPLHTCDDTLAELARIQHASTETDFHFFSDTEVTPGCTPPASRPCSPVQSDTEFEMNRQSKAVGTEDEDDDSGKTIHGQMQQSWRWGELPSPLPRSIIATQTIRSSIMKEKSEQEQISSSDEEANKKKNEAAAVAAEAAAQRSMLSGMFSFMKKTKRIRHNPESEGIYLSDLNADELDPEVAALYFPTSYRQGQGSILPHGTEPSGRLDEDDAESGNGTSLPQSPHSVEGAIGGPKSVDSDFEEPKPTIFEMKSYGELSLSLCGGLAEVCGPSEDTFLQHIVTYNDFVRDPKIVENPNLVVRLNGKYYNWRTACPLVMSLVVFQKELPQQVVESLCNEYMPLKKGQKKDVKSSSYSSWFYWRRPSEPKKTSGQDELSSPESEKIEQIKEVPEAETSTDKIVTVTSEGIEDKSTIRTIGAIEAEIERCKEYVRSEELKKVELTKPLDSQTYYQETSLSDDQKDAKEEGYSGSNSSEESDGSHSKTQGVKIPMERRCYYEHTDKYRKTLRLSSNQLARLNLREGGNEVIFSVTTAYQGTTRCKCHIYKWRFDDKIVISDIDGTITKSDVLGHILPIVGKDWAQSGVAQLFTKIKNNGYKLLYLSARAIGQARVTREYLRSIKQGDLSLPDGPLLLNPTSLLSAFHREVIEKKPEEFKISCLRDILALFPEDSKPFYAGYGNRINDVWAYRAVGIPIFRIFTINHRGELKHELTQTFQSSYSNMSYIVDQMFPPPPEDTSEDFTNFIYWRDPIPEIDVEISLSESQNPVPGTSVVSPAVAST